MEEESYIYLKNHKGHWFYLPESMEDSFASLLQEYILGNPQRFLKEFKDYRITSREEHKKNNLNK
jgi:hypothetical protein